METVLTINDLSFCYGLKPILQNITLTLKPSLTVLVGANGAGKSTLIKCIAGALKPKGEIMLTSEGDSTAKSIIRHTSYLPQAQQSNGSITVFEAVLLGLIGTLSLRVQPEQTAKVMQLLEEFGIDGIATKRLTELSGGQQQMVGLAQALIRDPKVLLLDEPLNNLDIRHQFEILNKVKQVAAASQTIILVAIHDLNLAAKYAESVIALHRGTVYAHGTPKEVLTESTIGELYGMRTEVTIKEKNMPHIRMLDTLNGTIAT
jgi:iron complex transport system ATP-binding protein